MSDLDELFDRADELLAAIRRGRVPMQHRAGLALLVQNGRSSRAALAGANAERRARVHAGIHRAADRFLPAHIARGTPARFWAGLLRGCLERRHEAFGLERWPCMRVVRAALKHWTPPSGGALESRYAAREITEASHGSERAQR